METAVISDVNAVARESGIRRVQEIVRGSLKAFIQGGLPPEEEAALRVHMRAVSWPEVLWMVRHHKVLPPFYEGLHAFPEDVPAETWASLRQQAQTNGLYSLTLSREFLELDAFFAASGARVVPVGGLAEAALVHGNLALSQSRFIRLRYLVRPSDVAALEEQLVPRGYDFDLGKMRTYHFGRTKSRIIWHTGFREDRPLPGDLFDALWERRREVTIGSRRVKTLAPEDLVLFLCREEAAHHRLNWRRLVEISALVAHRDGFSWDVMRETARRVGIEREVTLQLALAHNLLGIALPDDVRTDARDPVIRDAVARVKARANEGLPEPAFGERLRFRVGLKKGLGIKTAYAWRQTRKELGRAWKKVRRTGRAAKDIGVFAPTPMAVAEQMLRLADVGPEDLVYDLGSGDGRIVILAAKLFGARGVGIDFDADLVAQARKTAEEEGVSHLVSFVESDVMKVDLSPATVVTIYLQDFAFPRLLKKLRAELRPRTRIVSHDFFFKSWPPKKAEVVDAVPGLLSHIYLWEVT